MYLRDNQKNKTEFRVVVFAILFLLTSYATAKIMWLPLNKLVTFSDHIVIAQVQSVSVLKTNLKTGVSTLKNEMTIFESLKGTWSIDKPLILTTTEFANPTENWEEDSVSLPSAGLNVLLFLAKDDKETLWPTNGIQGVWPLSGNEPVGAGTGTSLDQVREAVRKQVNQRISADQAESIVWEIPEVQSLADAIRKKGRRPFTRVESSLEAQIVAGIQQMGYTIYFGEDTGTRTVRVMTFLVDAYTQKVFVYDIVTDGFILLDKWRAKN